MTSMPCPVEGCSKDVVRGGFCYSHYMKNWRYGTPTPIHVRQLQNLVGKRVGSLVVTSRIDGATWACSCDCGAKTTALSGDLNRGSKASCGDSLIHWRKGDAEYGAAHWRVSNDRGLASEYRCVDCDSQAMHWSYNHDDPDEQHSQSRQRRGVPFSLNPSHYSPRCVPCHKAFDLQALGVNV